MVADFDFENEQDRCAIVVNSALPVGRAANAAAVIAFTLGKRHPRLVGAELVDGSSRRHPGLIPIGIAVLAAPDDQLRLLSEKAQKAGIDIVGFPMQGQQTTDYDEFGRRVADVPTNELSYAGIGLVGTRKRVGRIIGKYPLLR